MPKIVDIKQKREAILLAAVRVFARKGLHRATMQEIAEEAGIGKGTIYEYFRSKEELFSAVFRYWTDRFKKEISQRLEGITNPRERIAACIDATLAVYHQSEELLELFFGLAAEGLLRENELPIKQEMEWMYREFRHLFAGLIEEGIRQGMFRPVDAPYIAALFIGMMDGLLLQYVVSGKRFDLERAVEQMKELVYRSLQKG